MTDHYPWTETERANLLNDIAGAMQLIAQPPPPPPTMPSRFVKRGFYMCCVTCGLEEHYCACSPRTPAQPSADDRAGERLEIRIREAMRDAQKTRLAVAPPGFALFCGSCGGRYEDCGGCRGGR